MSKLKFISLAKVLAAVLSVSIFVFILPFGKENQVHAGTLIQAKDLLSNSRLSFRGKIGTAANSGTTSITIDSNAPSADRYSDQDLLNLFPRDTVCFVGFGYEGCYGYTNYTVGSVPSQSSTNFLLTSTLTTAVGTTDYVVSTQSAVHTVTFIAPQAYNLATGATVQFLLPGPSLAAGSTSSSDSIPDVGTSISTSGFDLGRLDQYSGAVTCSGGGASWVNTGNTIIRNTVNGTANHQINCPFTGTLAAGSTVTMTIGLGSTVIVNPAPIKTSHTRGISDVYTATIRVLNPTGGIVMDSADIKLAPIEGVLVSATVDTTLSFTIGAVNIGTTHCNRAASVATTATTVPFGSISTNLFYDTAHTLTLSTNAKSGYSVTVVENGAMSLDGLGTTTIGEYCGNSGTPCNTLATRIDWTLSNESSLGYSMANTSGTDAAFTFAESSRTFSARAFDSVTARQIMSNSGPVNGNAADVCYRITISNQQNAGFYLNKLTYVATATFGN